MSDLARLLAASVRAYLNICHPTMTVETTSGVFFMPKKQSQILREQADKAEKCEKAEQEMRDALGAFERAK